MRYEKAVMEVKENSEFISDMIVDDKRRYLLATRQVTYTHSHHESESLDTCTFLKPSRMTSLYLSLVWILLISM